MYKGTWSHIEIFGNDGLESKTVLTIPIWTH